MTADVVRAFLLGLLVGMAILVVLILWATRPAAQARRRAIAEARHRAGEAWCLRVGWCPAHNVPDGECPPVDVLTQPLSVKRRAACPGSIVLAMHGPVVDAEGIEWHYSSALVR